MVINVIIRSGGEGGRVQLIRTTGVVLSRRTESDLTGAVVRCAQRALSAAAEGGLWSLT